MMTFCRQCDYTLQNRTCLHHLVTKLNFVLLRDFFYVFLEILIPKLFYADNFTLNV